MNEFIDPKIIINPNGIYRLATIEERKEIWKRMRNAGFIIDEINNVYFRPGYGALMDPAGNFETVDELKITSSRIFGVYKKLINDGYELVIGPGFPDSEGNINSKAIYCKNFQEILRGKNKDEGIKLK